MKNTKALSASRIKRLRAQGYTYHSSEELASLAFGNRFAYQVCTLLLGYGLLTADMSILGFMLGIAILGFVLENHPFDYIYNLFLAPLMSKPRLPKRSEQLKFACTLASLWIGITIYLFVSQELSMAYWMGGALFSVAFLAATTDICIPSFIYNAIYQVRTNPVHS